MVIVPWKKLFIQGVSLAFIILFSLNCHPAQAANPDPLRLQKMVNRFSWQDAKNTYPKNSILFVGSSSVYRWKTAYAFPEYPVINRGIPGAEIADLNYYYGDLVEKYRAATVIFYCGDNDIASGKSPEQILADFKTFTTHLMVQTNQPTLIFLAIKPSPQRWKLWSEMVETNLKIQRYCRDSHQCTFVDTATVLLNDKGQPDKRFFAEDGLHLNGEGYQLWNKLLYSVTGGDVLALVL